MAFENLIDDLNKIHKKLIDIHAEAKATRVIQQQVTATATYKEIDDTKSLVDKVIAELNIQAKRAS